MSEVIELKPAPTPIVYVGERVTTPASILPPYAPEKISSEPGVIVKWTDIPTIDKPLIPLEVGTTRSTVEKPIIPMEKTYRPTIVSLAYAREAAMAMTPILGTIRYAQYAKKDGLTAGEIGWIAGSAVLDLLCIIPLARLGAAGISTIRAAKVAKVASMATKVRTTKVIGPVARTGNTQFKLVNNLRSAIDSGDVIRIRATARKLENFGKVASVRKVTGGVDISKKAAYIRKNADAFAQTKIPVGVKKTLSRLDDAFAPYRASRQRLLHPKGAVEAVRAEPGVRVKTTVIPVTREEARGYGLSSRQVDDIFRKVGENRAAYMREAETIKRANIERVFEEINEVINRVKKTGTSVPLKRGKPYVPPKSVSTMTAEEAARLYGRKVMGGWSPAKAKVATDAYGAALKKFRVDPMLNPVKGKSPSRWRPFRPGEITKTRMRQLVSQWKNMKADLAVKQMIAARLLTPAIAYNTAAVTRILNAAPARTKAKAISQLSPEMRTALQTNLAQATTIAKAETSAIVKILTRAEAMAKVATLTEMLAEIITKTQVWTKAGLSVVSLTKLAVETRAAIKVATKVATRVVSKPPRPPIKKRFLLPLLPLPPGDAYARLSIFQKQGAVAWKQGFIYKLIYPPYGQENIINSRKPIAGVKLVKGIRSAYKSIIKARDKEGLLPSEITRDMGIMDIKIATPGQGRGKPKLQFKRDIKQRTRTTSAGISSVRR